MKYYMQFTLMLLIVLGSIVIVSEAKQSIFALDSKELSWIKTLKTPFKVGITQIPNQVLKDKNGTYKGLMIDLYEEISKLSGIKFEYLYYPSWAEVLEAGKKREIDIIFLAQRTPSRLGYFEFTDTVLQTQNNIIVQSYSDIESAEDLSRKRVALVSGSAFYEYIETNYPDIILVPAPTEKDALYLVSNGSADATIMGAVRASYYVKKYNIKNLRVGSDFGVSYNLRIASRQDMPILSTTLNKTLIGLPKEIKQGLFLKWGYIKDTTRFIDRQTLIYLGIFFGLILPLSIYLYIVNRQLKNEIKNRQKIISKLEEANLEIDKLRILAQEEARMDILTKIPNRRKFEEYFTDVFLEYKRTMHPFSLLFLDIDYFKNINDSFGHDVGDTILYEVANLLKKMLRENDKLGRIGGEEFAIILPDTKIDEAKIFSKHLCTTISKHCFKIGEETLQVTVSIGVSEVDSADDRKSLFKKVDSLVYKAKQDGRNRVCSFL